MSLGRPWGLRLFDAACAAGLAAASPYLVARLLFDPRYRDAFGERLGRAGRLPEEGLLV